MKSLGCIAALLLASCTAVPSPSQPQIALTIDDVPVHSPYPPGLSPNAVNRQMVAAIRSAGVPVIGFVNGIGVEQHPETIHALEGWRAAGFPLGNHTWSHPHLSEISVAGFDDELNRGEPLLSRLDGNADWRWFRYPFLDEGKDEAQRIADRAVLARHGYRVADVTMSFSDWAFTPAYARCTAARNAPAVAELERMYLDAAKESIAVARGTAHALYGRDIPYVLLMHVSAMSAHMMPRVIKLYRDAGFRFVSIAEAERDPAYRGYTDLSLPPPPADWELAKRRHVALPQGTDLAPRLAAMCPGEGPTATSP